MDLKIASGSANTEERQAVDSLLGAPQETSHGAQRDEMGMRVSTGGESLRKLRHLLLPTLHSVNDRVGFISRGAINYISQRLDIAPAEIYGVATFYALFDTNERPARQVHVCIDLACRAASGCTEETLPEGAIASPCLGTCERAPSVLVIETGVTVRQEVLAPATKAQIADLVAGKSAPAEQPIAQAAPQTPDKSLVLLSRIGIADPLSIDDYISNNGYTALHKAFAIGAEQVITEVTTSGLVGRGGAAFPTGRKWAAVASQPVKTRYLICNADESEPGTFKDRVLLEGDPFALVEAMTIAAFATGSQHGYIYLRGEYPRALMNLTNAIEVARNKNYLGDNILNSGFNFDITIFRGAGAYICGEETAIFNSIEGFRGEPRNKPPFPVEVGLFGKPTTVNNVETLLNVLPIINDSGEKYASWGSTGSKGKKLFCVSGAVNKPGVYEVTFGVTLRELINLAGGLKSDSTIQAVLLGGAAGGFVGPEDLDLELTLEAARAAGTTLGSGVVMVLDQNVNMFDQLQRIAAFFRDESCGQCVPCRVGTVRQQEALARLVKSNGTDSTAVDLQLLRDLGQVMRDASICGLGQTAHNAIDSALTRLKVFSA
ncbi:MAG: NAD(P)H-dependent oxidoreductase subunit E [Ilumatobacteraceae bacterium]|nr:NAD(P)H-dependent oxidoreductase subunit E [Ilumatobacteraceae bacterium]